MDRGELFANIETLQASFWYSFGVLLLLLVYAVVAKICESAKHCSDNDLRRAESDEAKQVAIKETWEVMYKHKQLNAEPATDEA